MSRTQGRGRTGARRGRILALALSIFVLPLLVISAFYSSLSLSPSDSPVFQAATQAHNANPIYTITTVSTFNFSRTTVLLTETSHRTQLNPSNIYLAVPASYVELFVASLFALAVIGLFYNLRLAQRRSFLFHIPEGDDVDAISGERQQIAQVLDETVAKLREGQEYRKTVIECYKLICEILERKTTVEGRMLTAREFREIVSNRLNLQTPYLTEATDLFELARYSESEVTKSQAETAIVCLTNLSVMIKAPSSMENNPKKSS